MSESTNYLKALKKIEDTNKIIKTEKKNYAPSTPIAIMHLPNHSGDHSQGNVRDTPTEDFDIVNKKYVDDNAGVTLWETNVGTGCAQLKVADCINVLDRFFYFDEDKKVGLIATGGDLGVGLEPGKVLKMNTNKITGVVDPTADQEAATKKYVDDNAGGAPEGTAVLSTGEGGGSLFLREDGDGTCSWQAAAGGGDVSKVETPVDNQIGIWTGDGTIEGDEDITYDGTDFNVSGNITVAGLVDGVDVLALSGSVAVNTSTIDTVSGNVAVNTSVIDTVSGSVAVNTSTIDTVSGNVATNTSVIDTVSGNMAVNTSTIDTVSGNLATHEADSTNPHGVTLTQTGIVSSGTISGSTIVTTSDFTASGNAVMRNILIGTEETPPTASSVTQGTLYVQYTA